jgi:hypothetical protein
LLAKSRFLHHWTFPERLLNEIVSRQVDGLSLHHTHTVYAAVHRTEKDGLHTAGALVLERQLLEMKEAKEVGAVVGGVSGAALGGAVLGAGALGAVGSIESC